MEFKKILITTGDVDGIGLEVACKALSHLGPQKSCVFFLFRSVKSEKYRHQSSLVEKLDKKFERVVVDSFAQAFHFFSHMKTAKDLSSKILFDVVSSEDPAVWVEQAAKLCFKQQASALVTGPLSKTHIQESGFRDLGHTDILKRVSKVKTVHMGFVGDHFNVVLTTGHIAVREVHKKLNFKSLTGALLNANGLRKVLPKKHRRKPIAVLGLNPHSGEKGLIGQEELALFPHLKAFAKENDIPMEGPLVPDAAFLRKNWERYSLFLALYHDQGLIPFKAIHGQDSGVHLSLGLPFVRTSVDHGTAKDLFGKNQANAKSMQDAIQWAMNLSN